MTESSAAVPEGAALPRQAVAFWPGAQPGSASWQDAAAGREPRKDRGSGGAVWWAVLSHAASGLQEVEVFTSAGAPIVAPCPCVKSNRLSTAFACESRHLALHRASPSSSGVSGAAAILCSQARGKAKKQHA